MSKQFIVTATGTDIGKTLTSAILMLGLDADYWKPIQSGTPTDTDTVKTITGLPGTRFHAERYRLRMPVSPHLAAQNEGITIDISQLTPPQTTRTLIIEGAGGLMVPVTRSILMIDVFRQMNIPIILCARTELGTINHTLLSVEALRSRKIHLHGIIFLGPEHPDSIKTILDFSRAPMLGHIPQLAELSAPILHDVFHARFKKDDFQ